MDKDLLTAIEEIKQEREKMKALADFPAMEKKIAKLSDITLKDGLWDDPQKAGKLMKELEGLKKDLESFRRAEKSAESLFEMAQMYGEDESFRKELLEESAKLSAELRGINIKLQFNDPADGNGAIVTLHSGAGGTEACDWCQMLLRMYTRWCERRGYDFKIIDMISGDEAGLKSVTFEVSGRFAYGYLKSETGIHRLVRISPFDSNKRRHTSFASCDVIPDLGEIAEVEIKDSDLKIDTYRASGAGGQHVNKTDSAVRITHLPTGVIVACQNERSQHQNKARAMQLLQARLAALEEDKRKDKTQRRYDGMGQIGWGHQIRSYVFMPYQMAKDLRTGYETGNISAVMDGDIDGFIEAYLTHGQNEK
ncbi:MAG: peptide chain release factor 2 [Elusimicrobia bacterium CG_4_10_14_3_um_filter_49_12_50_7]|nr:MAG: peptide chain release factor 2 [Elusimicrobia bacterium CG03_land_8_20_14_0_80_50_18]PIY16720.1 MAG: peptide chain release factor 2 [Elusimicrobia bacterium CG_4_10_14_3_um_filter_49_12_50_7]